MALETGQWIWFFKAQFITKEPNLTDTLKIKNKIK
jgi:hypothetical protein